MKFLIKNKLYQSGTDSDDMSNEFKLMYNLHGDHLVFQMVNEQSQENRLDEKLVCCWLNY